MELIVTNATTGEQARTIGRAWWTDGALEVRPGRIEVARIHAESLTRRMATDADFEAGRATSPYESGVAMTGKPCAMIIGLTDAELALHGIVPGKLVWPHVVDAPRPKNNRTANPASMQQYTRAMSNLQNEGY